MKRCLECKEIYDTSAAVCLSCGGVLWNMSKDEEDTYKKNIEKQRKRREKIQWLREKVFDGFSILSGIILIMSYVIAAFMGKFQWYYLGLILIWCVGVFDSRNPRFAWEMDHMLRRPFYDALEPSDLALSMIRIGGMVMMIFINVVVVLVLYFS